jgi:hypothetical protein
MVVVDVDFFMLLLLPFAFAVDHVIVVVKLLVCYYCDIVNRFLFVLLLLVSAYQQLK